MYKIIPTLYSANFLIYKKNTPTEYIYIFSVNPYFTFTSQLMHETRINKTVAHELPVNSGFSIANKRSINYVAGAGSKLSH